ncbi:hypothetical protein Dimus_029664, partial [Dionaea muscipula]
KGMSMTTHRTKSASSQLGSGEILVNFRWAPPRSSNRSHTGLVGQAPPRLTIHCSSPFSAERFTTIVTTGSASSQQQREMKGRDGNGKQGVAQVEEG